MFLRVGRCRHCPLFAPNEHEASSCISDLSPAPLALSAAVPAVAADLTYETPAPAAEQISVAYDWSGFYLGGQGGYSWSQTKILGSDENIDGGTAGLHAGYNFQSGNIVYGIENDFNYNFKKNDDANLEWDASGRARVGYALDRTLFFATAGVAAGGGKVDIPTAGKKDGILIGWTAGGGIEHAVTDHILGARRVSPFRFRQQGLRLRHRRCRRHAGQGSLREQLQVLRGRVAGGCQSGCRKGCDGWPLIRPTSTFSRVGRRWQQPDEGAHGTTLKGPKPTASAPPGRRRHPAGRWPG